MAKRTNGNYMCITAVIPWTGHFSRSQVIFLPKGVIDISFQLHRFIGRFIYTNTWESI